jgi:hypothetical protein
MNLGVSGPKNPRDLRCLEGFLNNLPKSVINKIVRARKIKKSLKMS